MREPCHYVLRCNRSQGLGNGLIERLPRSLPSLPHQVLYLPEGFLYGVEAPAVDGVEVTVTTVPAIPMSSYGSTRAGRTIRKSSAKRAAGSSSTS
jgi:hypothetical protein